MRRLLPLLHAQPAGLERAGLQLPSRIRAGPALYRVASRGARRSALGRRSAAAQRPKARPPARAAACHPARGVHSHRLAHPGVSAPAHHARALRDFQKTRPDLDEHPCQPSARGDGRAEGGVRPAELRRRAAGQPVRAAARGQ